MNLHKAKRNITSRGQLVNLSSAKRNITKFEVQEVHYVCTLQLPSNELENVGQIKLDGTITTDTVTIKLTFRRCDESLLAHFSHMALRQAVQYTGRAVSDAILQPPQNRAIVASWILLADRKLSFKPCTPRIGRCVESPQIGQVNLFDPLLS